MADVRPVKIELRSRRYATELMQHVISTVEESTSYTLEIDENDKKQWKSRFREVNIKGHFHLFTKRPKFYSLVLA